MRHCFAYGTLMCEDIMRAVSGHLPPHERAELADYARHPVVGEHYPGIRPRPGARVAGVLYRDLGSTALARLDAFEGEQYLRRSVTVRLADGSAVPAETYVFKPQYAHLLAPGDWDYDAFLRSGRGGFEAQYLGYTRLPR